MIKLAKAFLYLQAICLAAFGLFFMFFPVEAAAKIYVAPMSSSGTSELRAFYGGSFIAIATMLLIGLRSVSSVASGLLIAVGGLMTLIAVIRLISLFADGFSPDAIVAGVIESLIALCCLILFRARSAPA